MSARKEDCGPAFPVPEFFADTNTSFPGMTLRDWFAGRALTGLLSDSNLKAPEKEFARNAYRMADAMLAERSK